MITFHSLQTKLKSRRLFPLWALLLILITLQALGYSPLSLFMMNPYTPSWDYRVITLGNDSSSVSGWCGEFLLENSNIDTLKIRNMIWDPGIDTTITGANDMIMSENFRSLNDTKLHLYRVILVHQRDSNYTNRNLPDTLAWSIQLYNAKTDQQVSTLDSIGCYPVTSGKRYPYQFGTDTTKTKFTYNLSGISGVDSCYLKFKIYRWGTSTALINLLDAELFEQLSELFSLPSDMAKKYPSIIISSLPKTPEMTMEVFPNPVKYQAQVSFQLPEEKGVRLKIYNTYGEFIQEIYHDIAGEKITTIQYIPIIGLPTGKYIMILSDEAGHVLSYKNILLIK